MPSAETSLPSNVPLLYFPSRTKTQALGFSAVVVALYCYFRGQHFCTRSGGMNVLKEGLYPGPEVASLQSQVRTRRKSGSPRGSSCPLRCARCSASSHGTCPLRRQEQPQLRFRLRRGRLQDTTGQLLASETFKMSCQRRLTAWKCSGLRAETPTGSPGLPPLSGRVWFVTM